MDVETAQSEEENRQSQSSQRQVDKKGQGVTTVTLSKGRRPPPKAPWAQIAAKPYKGKDDVAAGSGQSRKAPNTSAMSMEEKNSIKEDQSLSAKPESDAAAHPSSVGDHLYTRVTSFLVASGLITQNSMRSAALKSVPTAQTSSSAFGVPLPRPVPPPAHPALTSAIMPEEDAKAITTAMSELRQVFAEIAPTLPAESLCIHGTSVVEVGGKIVGMLLAAEDEETLEELLEPDFETEKVLREIVVNCIEELTSSLREASATARALFEPTAPVSTGVESAHDERVDVSSAIASRLLQVRTLKMLRGRISKVILVQIGCSGWCINGSSSCEGVQDGPSTAQSPSYRKTSLSSGSVLPLQARPVIRSGCPTQPRSSVHYCRNCSVLVSLWSKLLLLLSGFFTWLVSRFTCLFGFLGTSVAGF